MSCFLTKLLPLWERRGPLHVCSAYRCSCLCDNFFLPLKAKSNIQQLLTLTYLASVTSSHDSRAVLCDSVVCVADGSPLSWWLDREGERRSYWGGFVPGAEQCSCNLEDNCSDRDYLCTCDADTDKWCFFLLFFFFFMLLKDYVHASLCLSAIVCVWIMHDVTACFYM